MSARPGSFRWFVGTPNVPRVPLTDAVMEQVPQRPTMKLSVRASQSEMQIDALQLKDEILAMVAHELRGPLTPLQFATNLIRRASPDRADVLRSADMIDRQIAQISRLADDLMDAIRVERRGASRDQGPRRRRRGASCAASRNCVGSSAAQAEVNGPDFRQNTSINCDPDRLAQAVNNLLHNALKYTPESGCITVKVLADRNALVLSVKDDGMGISDALMPHIFELFAQASRTIGASVGVGWEWVSRS